VFSFYQVNAKAAGFATATLALDTEPPAGYERRAVQEIRTDIHWESEHDHADKKAHTV